MSVTSPVTKPKPLNLKKLKRLSDQHLKQLLQAVTVAEGAAAALRGFAMEYRDDAEAQLQVMQDKLDGHLKRTARSPVNFRPHPNKRWTVAFGDMVYECGPLPDFADLDDDEPHYYWSGPNGERHMAVSLFQALIGIVQEYHNAEHIRPTTDTGPVST